MTTKEMGERLQQARRELLACETKQVKKLEWFEEALADPERPDDAFPEAESELDGLQERHQTLLREIEDLERQLRARGVKV